jgi:hypothetical protein
MAKASTKSKISVEKSILATLPWASSSFGKQAEIDGFNPATGKWETIATTQAFSDVDAEDLASFMVNAANWYAETQAKKPTI